jgi:hypothetical protein
VLKPGVVYQPGVGSYVDDTPIPARTHP